VPIAVALAVGAGGAERSARELGPLVTFALPLVAMVAFWWERWPGTRLRPSWSGWADTVVIAVGAVVLQAVGDQLVSEPVTFAAAAFIAMLELTLVGERWPLQRLPVRAGGVLALAISWAVAAAVYAAFADVRSDLAPALIVIGAYQALFYVAWRGWPFARIAGRGRRLTCAHVAVLGAGIATYLAVHGVLGVEREPLAAWAACFVAAALVFGMQFEDWLDRTGTLIAALALTAALVVLLRGVPGTTDEWVIHASLNAIGVSVILHVAIGRRWPFAADP
jgi:hypothetical protein